ncbi:porin family protein [Rufibacter sediminis]|uniref:PorT family protein n=1 Tax=Rufibacter sediminis TaxID=2762756 RepID=A0ABR6VU41_9BACT|nr:porin family protein [Rufibacter sediminis]MBC3540435.1 PorT family protein [Rufibacter sediminis]
MKKIAILTVAVFTSYFAQAQTGPSIGVKAGVNYSTITADNDNNVKYKPDFHLGAFADFSISDMVSIRPELLYSRKGAKFEFSGTEVVEDEFGDEQTITGTVDGKLIHQYLELPVLAHIKAGNLFFEGGPTFAYLLKSEADMKIEYSGDDMDFSMDETTEITEDMKRFEFGYAAGIGYELPSGLGLTLRYQGGLSDLNKNSDQDTDDEDLGAPSGKMKNSVFQLSLSYRFGGR